MSGFMETRFGIRESGNLDSWKETIESVKARVRIRRSGNLNSWKGTTESVKARIRIRGKECRNCSPRQHSAVQQTLQRAASAIAAHYIRPRSTLASSATPSANGPTVHSYHHNTSSYYERETDKYPRKSSLHE